MVDINIVIKYLNEYIKISRMKFGDSIDDVKQDMLINALTSLKRYDENKGNLKNYLFGVFSNTEKRAIREKIYRMNKTVYYEELEDDDNNDLESKAKYNILESIFKYEDKKDSTETLIDELIEEIEESNKKRCRKISTENLKEITQLFIDGYTQVEIAKMYGVSQRSIFKKINYMRNALINIYKREGIKF